MHLSVVFPLENLPVILQSIVLQISVLWTTYADAMKDVPSTAAASIVVVTGVTHIIMEGGDESPGDSVLRRTEER